MHALAAIIAICSAADLRFDASASAGVGISLDAVAPVTAIGAGVEMGNFALSVRGVLPYSINAPSYVPDGSSRSSVGYRGWIVAAELRVRSTGTVGGVAVLGAGAARMLGDNCDCFESSVVTSGVSPNFYAGGGFEARVGRLRFGLDALLHYWTGLSRPMANFSPAESGATMFAVSLLLRTEVVFGPEPPLAPDPLSSDPDVWRK
jgi:hypothetical protein